MYRLRYVAETPIPPEFEIYFYDEVAKVINGEVIVEKEYNKDRLLKMGFELIGIIGADSQNQENSSTQKNSENTNSKKNKKPRSHE